MPAYSLKDVTMTINGEGGNLSLKEGTGDEGISIEPTGDQNNMTEGADGTVMHSLSASSASTVTLRLLKTSPVNAQLMTMFNYQTGSASRWGTNTITVEDTARGDLVTVTNAAFKKAPPLKWAKVGDIVEWQFDGGQTTYVLGKGVTTTTEA
ncbi:phage protein [Pseudodesulfovibrio sp.]|uniref:phage protein n=1 Tax=Pseudodesulfovibrio sp. TaxID=2035812 RepID=UPI002613C798|nr:phage protein [Pseudodesulfovibrio sp.]MDD3310952.1 DUF3277 family protein [Pseudodesulfovibrio sp.]